MTPIEDRAAMSATLSTRPTLAMFAAALLLAAAPAHAEDAPAPEKPAPERPAHDWTVTLGAGVLYKPAFLGSDDYQAMAVPDIKVEYKDVFFASPFEGVGFTAIDSDGWRAGPIAKYDFGRTEDDDNPFRIAGGETTALKGLGDIDGSFEIGGFLEYNYEQLGARLELRQGIGGHEGFVGEAGVSYTGMTDAPGLPVVYSIGPRLAFADSNYNGAYFGIDAGQSARSGLARYDADFGLVSYGIGGFAAVSLTDSVSLGVFAGYDRLGEQAADSPLVRDRGDENQFMAGLRLGYALQY